MTPAAVEVKLATHESRLDTSEEAIARIERKLDQILFGTIAALLAALGGLAAMFLKHG